MKVLVILYYFILIVFCLGSFFLSFTSSHHIDTSVTISNWTCLVSFPFTIYLANKFFYNKAHSGAVIFFLAVNSIIFFYCCYSLIKYSDDGLSDAVVSLLIPVAGFLLSIFFILKFTYSIIKAEKY